MHWACDCAQLWSFLFTFEQGHIVTFFLTCINWCTLMSRVVHTPHCWTLNHCYSNYKLEPCSRLFYLCISLRILYLCLDFFFPENIGKEKYRTSSLSKISMGIMPQTYYDSSSPLDKDRSCFNIIKQAFYNKSFL